MCDAVGRTTHMTVHTTSPGGARRAAGTKGRCEPPAARLACEEMSAPTGGRHRQRVLPPWAPVREGLRVRDARVGGHRAHTYTISVRGALGQPAHT